MKAKEDPSVFDGLRAEVRTVSWRAIWRHTEMTVWVQCSRGGTTWDLPLEVLPTLEVLEGEPEPTRPVPSREVRFAARMAASSYVTRNRLSLKEIFRQVH